MNKAAKKWVKELRSGKWQQATKCLRLDNAYCCLGVANEISGIGFWDGQKYIEPETRTHDSHAEEQFASPRVQRWLGLATPNGEISLGDDDSTSLDRLNDEGKSFAEIADVIEKYADQLFVHESK